MYLYIPIPNTRTRGEIINNSIIWAKHAQREPHHMGAGVYQQAHPCLPQPWDLYTCSHSWFHANRRANRPLCSPSKAGGPLFRRPITNDITNSSSFSMYDGWMILEKQRFNSQGISRERRIDCSFGWSTSIKSSNNFEFTNQSRGPFR